MEPGSAVHSAREKIPGTRRDHQGSAAVPVPSVRNMKLEQEKLSGVVKSVHRSLRRKYLEGVSINDVGIINMNGMRSISQLLGFRRSEYRCRNPKTCQNPDFHNSEAGDFDKIWKEHCKDEEKLCEYAAAMKNLADNHWAKKCEGEGRIEWCLGVCQEYFFNGGKRKAIEKDARRAMLNNHQPPSCEQVLVSGLDISNITTPNQEFHHPGKIRLLDVGSCYNPFMKYEDFLAVGIDIVPAVETVYNCDFLNLQIQRPLQLAPDAVEAFLKQLKSPIDYLPAELFHVVVFSLLLSYFPSRYQRWICCKKAHELLALNGLLLIITPDSSNQNRHAMMMKSWKTAIESLGFKRMTYSKFSHMHLMTFRKTSLKTTSDLITRNYPDMLYIPQDFNFVAEEEYSSSCYARSELEDEQLAYTFSELPDTPYDSDSGESHTSSMSFYEFEDPILLLS